MAPRPPVKPRDGLFSGADSPSSFLAIRSAMDIVDFLEASFSAARSSSVFSQIGLFAEAAALDLVALAPFFVLAVGRTAEFVWDGGGVTAFAQDGTLAAPLASLGSSLAAARSLAIISRSRSISSSLVSGFSGSFFFLLPNPISTSISENFFFWMGLSAESVFPSERASAAVSNTSSRLAGAAEDDFGAILPSGVTLDSFGFSKKE